MEAIKFHPSCFEEDRARPELTDAPWECMEIECGDDDWYADALFLHDLDRQERTDRSKGVYIKEKIDAKLRWQIFRRDGYECQKCGAIEDLTVDHVYPEWAGGGAFEGNLQTLCRSCNTRKGAK